MATHALIALALFLFGFATRLPFALLHSSDEWGVYSFLHTLSRRKWISYDCYHDVRGKEYPYPLLFHFLVSRFPSRHWRVAGFSLNSAWDALVAVILYAALAARLPEAQPQTLAMACIVFLALPILLPVNARVKSFSGRSFGMLTTTLYFLCLFWMHSAQTVAGAACAGILAMALTWVTFLASKFGIQALTGLTLGTALVMLSPLLLCPMLLALLLGWFLPALKLKPLLIFSVNHYRYYVSHMARTVADSRSLFKSLAQFAQALIRDPWKAREIFLFKSPLLILACGLPLLFDLGWRLATAPPLLGPPELLCLGVLAGALGCFVLTSMGNLRVLGQAERYFEYASAPAVFLWMVALANTDSMTTQYLAWFFVLNVAILCCIHFLADIRQLKSFLRYDFSDGSYIELLDFLEQHPEVRAATLPIKLSFRLADCQYGTGRPPTPMYFRSVGGGDFIGSMDEFSTITATCDVFHDVIDLLRSNHGITHIIVDQTFPHDRTMPIMNSLLQQSIVFRNKVFTVYSTAQ